MEPNDLATAFAVWAAVVGMIGVAAFVSGGLAVADGELGH